MGRGVKFLGKIIYFTQLNPVFSADSCFGGNTVILQILNRFLYILHILFLFLEAMALIKHLGGVEHRIGGIHICLLQCICEYDHGDITGPPPYCRRQRKHQPQVQGDQLALCFWYLVKRDLSSVRYCLVAYT